MAYEEATPTRDSGGYGLPPWPELPIRAKPAPSGEATKCQSDIMELAHKKGGRGYGGEVGGPFSDVTL